MRIVCSWCRGEGQIGLVGEKAPFEDRRETHGICVTHRTSVQTRWKDATYGSGKSGLQLFSVGVENEMFSGSVEHYVFSVTQLWRGLRKLARRSRS